MRVSVFHCNFLALRTVQATPARVQQFIANQRKRYRGALYVRRTKTTTFLYVRIPQHSHAYMPRNKFEAAVHNSLCLAIIEK